MVTEMKNIIVFNCFSFCFFFQITILVLIFTAKEHNENSYTKSDKSNKVIK